MRCKSCGNDVKSDFKYCPFCASRLMQDFNEQFGDLEPPVLQMDPVERANEKIIYGEIYEAAAQKPAQKENPPILTAGLEEKDWLLDMMQQPLEIKEAKVVSAQSPTTAPEEAERVETRRRERRKRDDAGYVVYRPGVTTAQTAPPQEKPHIPTAEPFKPTLPVQTPVPTPAPSHIPPKMVESDSVLPPPPLNWDNDEVGEAFEEVEELISFEVPQILEDISGMNQRPAPTQTKDMDEARLEAAPYVEMKPEIAHETHQKEKSESAGTGPVFKVLLLVFIILVGILTSVAIYWYVVTSDWFNRQLDEYVPMIPDSAPVEVFPEDSPT